MATDHEVNLCHAGIGKARTSPHFSREIAFDQLRFETGAPLVIGDEADPGPEDGTSVDSAVVTVAGTITGEGVVVNDGPDGIGISGSQLTGFTIDLDTLHKTREKLPFLDDRDDFILK